MANTESNRGSVVVAAIKSNGFLEISKDYGEPFLDGLMESGVLKDIPLINTIVSVFNISSSVSDQLILNKIYKFIVSLSSISSEDRLNMIEKLNASDKYAGRAGTAIIEILDRLESERKPEMVAKCFAYYAKEEISFEELRRLIVAIERIPTFDIPSLRSYSNGISEEILKMDEGMLLSFVNAGLAQNNGGLSGGVIMPTKLCKRFIELNLDI